MIDRTEFLMYARRIHNALRHEIENMDVSPEKLPVERPLFEHFACGLYLAGCLAFLEGKYGAQPWLPKSPLQGTFDQFLLNLPQNVFSAAGISQGGVQALVCIRNAITHNDRDLKKNTDKSCLTKVTAANLPGVSINGSLITLASNTNTDFMEYVRKTFMAITMFHGGA